MKLKKNIRGLTMIHPFLTNYSGWLFSGGLVLTDRYALYETVNKYALLSYKGNPVKGMDFDMNKSIQSERGGMQLNFPVNPLTRTAGTVGFRVYPDSIGNTQRLKLRRNTRTYNCENEILRKNDAL